MTTQRMKIVLGDDDRETRDLLRAALERAGVAVVEVANPLKLVSTLEVDDPDALVLDPGIHWADSVAVCEGLHRREAFERLPVVFLCAKTDSEAADVARRAGASDYFLKPIDADAVAIRLVELVNQTRALRA